MNIRRPSRAPRRRLVAALTLSVGLLATACGGDDDESTASAAPATSEERSEANEPSSDEPFRVLAIMPLSGPGAVGGNEELAGLRAAANVINAEGGILGHQVELDVVDDAGVGTTAVSLAMEKLAAGTDYNMILPGINGADAVPLAGALADTEILQITPAAERQLDDPDEYPYLFSTLNNFGPNAEGVVAELEREGIGRVVFIAGDNASGRGAGEAFEEAAAEAGIDLAATVFVPDDAVDATPQVQQALAADPEAFVTGAFTLALPGILKARATLAPDVPFYADAFASAANFGAFLEPAKMAGIRVQAFPQLVKGDPAQDDPAFQAFHEAYLAENPQPKLSLIAGIVAYNTLMVARAAAEIAGTIDGKALAEAMPEVQSLDDAPGFVGPTVSAIFSPTQHQLAVSGDDLGFYDAGPIVMGMLEPLSS